MKGLLLVISAVTFFILGGCSVLDDVNNTLTYVNEATDYVNEASTFANEIPSMTEQAASGQQARKELETKLKEMDKDIQEFNELQPPEVAADLHQQIVEQNKKIEEGIDVYLNNIENGQLDPNVLGNTEIVQSIEEITATLDQIKELGQ